MFHAAVTERVAFCDKELFVLYDFETTQNTPFSETAAEHVPYLICLQQFCSKCEQVEDRKGLLAVREEKTLILVGCRRGLVIVSICAATMGQQGRCDSSYCQIIRLAFHYKQSAANEMAT
jgi:hypothetical protein